MSLKLSIVDQVPVHAGHTQAEALHLATCLAKKADDWGFHRYWFAEHHATPCYACASPEIMIGHIAAHTQRIRVGSGGVMLSHYSPYKVAEQFRTLSALFPDRIDIGVGRAPGGSGLPTLALNYPYAGAPNDDFLSRLGWLTEFMEGDEIVDRPYAGLSTTPQGPLGFEKWQLGSSSGSIELAARFGWGFVLALFIGNHERPAEIVNQYRQKFKQYQGENAQSQALIATATICADSKEEAEHIAASHTFWKLQSQMRGIREGLRSPEECVDLLKQASPSEVAFFEETRNNMVTGTAEECRDRLEELAKYYGVDEVVSVSVTHDYSVREKSYEKLAKVFDLAD